MSRASNPDEILDAVRNRLIASQIFSKSNCFVAQADQEWQTAPDQIWATIWPSGGMFDPEQMDGGMPTFKGSIDITVHTAVLLDKAGEDEKVLRDSQRGLLVACNRIMQSLWLHDLGDVDGEPLLAEPMRPLGLPAPVRVPNIPASLLFPWEIVFEWRIDEEQ